MEKLFLVVKSDMKRFGNDHPSPETSNVPYRVFKIGNSQSVRLIEYIEAIEEALGKAATG